MVKSKSVEKLIDNKFKGDLDTPGMRIILPTTCITIHTVLTFKACHLPAYKLFLSSDLPGQYDYSCRYTLGGVGCTVSVYDQREAEDLCDREPDCKAFVLSHNHKTWTGEILDPVSLAYCKPVLILPAFYFTKICE